MPKNCSIRSAVKAPTTADPVAGSMRTGQHRGAIQRRIERRIRSEREEEEERGDAHQEPDQLVEPPVPGGNKNSCQIIHWARFTHTEDTTFDTLQCRNRPEPYHYAKKRVIRQCRKTSVVSI